MTNEQRKAAAEAAFRARLAELGAELLEPYRGKDTPVRVRCRAGHECRPTPSNIVRRRQGVCRTCAGKDPAVAEAAFRERLAEQGAVLLEPYRGKDTPVLARCQAGHECSPTPSAVRRGEGACRICAGMIWDAFYVVRNPSTGEIKFGVASGDSLRRLAAHRTDGYTERVRLFTSMPDKAAPEIEATAISALARAGIKPVRGREYYEESALAVVLDICDNHPSIAVNPQGL